MYEIVAHDDRINWTLMEHLLENNIEIFEQFSRKSLLGLFDFLAFLFFFCEEFSRSRICSGRERKK
jgi:hypothetical protein